MSILGKIFKSKLDQRQFEFKEEYWKELEKKLDAQSGKGGANYFGWLLSSVVLVVLTTVAIWFFYPGKENKTAEVSKPVKMVQENSEKQIGNQQLSIRNNEKTENKNQENVGLNVPEKLLPEKSLGNIKSSVGLKPGLHPESYNPALKNGAISGKNKPDFNSESVKDNIIGSPEKNILVEGKEKIQSEKSELVNSSEQKETNLNVAENISPNENTASDKTENFAPTNIEKNISLVMMNKIPAMELPESENNSLKILAAAEQTHRRKLHWFAGAYSGVMYSGKILKSNSAEMNEYISRRKKEETSTLSKQFGIDAGFSLNRWSFSTGINYHQQAEIVDYKPQFYQWLKNSTPIWNDNSHWKYSTSTFSIQVDNSYWAYQNDTINYTTQQGTTATTIISVPHYVDSNLQQHIFTRTDSSFVHDSTATAKTDSVNKLVTDQSLKPQKTVTKFSYFEVPLMVGYEIPVSRITLLVRTGVSVAMLSQYRATYLKNDISGVETIAATQVNKTMLNYLLRTSILYHLTENIAFSFEPMFRMNINSVFKDNSFSQKYWNAGVNAGVMYRF